MKQLKRLYSNKMKLALSTLVLGIPSIILASLVFSPNDAALTTVQLSDGKFLIGGSFTPNRIARLNLDGTVDQSFSQKWQSDGFNDTVRVLAVQSDGKILAGGDFTRFDISLESRRRATRDLVRCAC